MNEHTTPYRPAVRFLAEGFLWFLTHAISLTVAGGAAWLSGKMLLGLGPVRLGMWVGLVMLSALTWGSWASLIWTRSRFWRVLEGVVTFLPGVVMLLAGALIAYGTAMSKPLLYMPIFLGGAGSIALAYFLGGGFMTQNKQPSRMQFLFGLLVFPLVTCAVSLLAWTGWVSFLSTSALDLCRESFVNPGKLIAKYFTLSMLFALTSTVFPAAVSRLCRDVDQRLKSRR